MKSFYLAVAFSVLAASVVMAQQPGEIPPAPPLPGAAAAAPEPTAPSAGDLTPVPTDTADELAPPPTDKDEPGGKCEGKGKGGCSGYALLVPSDHCYDDFISPITNPMYFEDPRTLTEVRFIYMNHRIPLVANTSAGAVPLGGDGVQVYSLQARVAVTDRLSIIATKDGMVISDSVLLDDGYTDVAAGVKYNLYKDPCLQRLLSAGLTYEIPIGAHRALQGGGEGEFNVFLSGGTELWGGHWLSAAGYRFPASDEESSMFYWSNHFDKELGNSGIYGLVEFNWFNWVKSGTNPALNEIEGFDLINLGSTGVAGNDIVTAAVGAKYKPNGHTELGVAWEFPLTDRRDIMENRLTADIILRY